ncbi:hypothetical protein BurJ1DRAFT_4125 [Burkholderiales bacterium JOSHI_001]|nr:hypothetical protein BurJ1DRAFT_4125 [Burkholderiales bacterium JOSHI_001]
MCGIFGIVSAPDAQLGPARVLELFSALGSASQTRGREGSGFLAVTHEVTYVHRSPDAFDLMSASPEFADLVQRVHDSAKAGSGLALIGHARLATNGSQGIECNNQPVGVGSVYCLHNGIVVNAASLWDGLAPSLPKTEVDSEVIPALVAHQMDQGQAFGEAVSLALSKLDGEFSVAVADASSGAVALSTNNGSLYRAFSADGKVCIFASEQFIVTRFTGTASPNLGAGSRWEQVPLGGCLLLDRQNPCGAPSTPRAPAADPAHAAPAPVARQRLHDTMRDAQDRYQRLKRCTRCVLPATMPFIHFDAQGVCNYCHNHRTKQLLGEPKLEELLSKFRSRDGSPDCVIAFSGGRDSSYALHLLKRRYGMNPIAYTYDWGMVTDIARRNQARMCGKLGVEHIWISADIGAKRRNIRANVEAWMANPDLGMIPLFMAGDKQFFYHGHQTMKNTGIKMMVFATNHYEKTDFKIGFCGIPPVTDQDRPNYLNMGRKASLVRYYLWQFMRNPRYINRSVPDTFGAFLSYYGLDNEATFLHLFDYVPWVEHEIDRTLIGEYGWETAPDSSSTWRIGDGTAALYNYIYRTVCGFSEQETFRSNQLREGIITRDEAMALVQAESAPRFDSIQEYCSLIGVPFSALLSSIYRLPRLY